MRDFLRFARHFVEILHFVRAVLLVLLAALAACAALLVLVEDYTVGNALYFTLITAMTVGYGDIIPATALGRVVSVAIAMIGVVYVGIVVAIATRAVAQAVEEKRSEGE